MQFKKYMFDIFQLVMTHYIIFLLFLAFSLLYVTYLNMTENVRRIEWIPAYLISTILILLIGVSIFANSYERTMKKYVSATEKAGYVSNNYVKVTPYKVESYLPADKKNSKKAEVLLKNGKVVKDVTFKEIESISKNNNDTLTFYDINLKEKYQPTEKDKFRKQVLVLNKQRTVFSTKERNATYEAIEHLIPSNHE